MNTEHPTQIITYIQNHSTLRVTKHLKECIYLLSKTSHPLSVLDISGYFDSEIHLSTLHRIVDKLVSVGVVNYIDSDRGKLFEISDMFRHHHHHFSCSNCHKIYDLPKCNIDTIIQQNTIINSVSGHNIEIRGICSNCSK